MHVKSFLFLVSALLLLLLVVLVLVSDLLCVCMSVAACHSVLWKSEGNSESQCSPSQREAGLYSVRQACAASAFFKAQHLFFCSGGLFLFLLLLFCFEEGFHVAQARQSQIPDPPASTTQVL